MLFAIVVEKKKDVVDVSSSGQKKKLGKVLSAAGHHVLIHPWSKWSMLKKASTLLKFELILTKFHVQLIGSFLFQNFQIVMWEGGQYYYYEKYMWCKISFNENFVAYIEEESSNQLCLA